MSNKASGLVWDLECPKQYGDILFRPMHKYVLAAYADHADHHGKNIYPAVPTIARKTGLEDRSVQRLTRDLETIGLLVEDGQGPRGTNRWKLPYNDRGDSLSPVTLRQGDSDNRSLGDSASGDSASGDSPSPELKEPEPLDIKIGNKTVSEIWATVLELSGKHNLDRHLKSTWPANYFDETLFIKVENAAARDWLTERATLTIEHLLVGITARDIGVRFI